jgi:hypothetical protein
VTFPKLVVHASLAGLYGGLVVALLLALGNPGAASRGGGAGLFVVVLAYTLATALFWPLLYAGLRFFARHPLRLPWLSLRYVMGFHAVNTGAILTAGWFMLSDNRATLGPRDADRLASACLSLSLAWLVAAVITVVPRLRRRSWVQAAAGATAVVVLIVAASGGTPAPAAKTLQTGALSPPPGGAPGGVVPPDVDRPAPRASSGLPWPGTGAAAPASRRAPAARRLVLLNFDGADLDSVLTMHGQGKLPAFSRFIQEGASGRLVPVKPCVAPVARTSLATGMLPYRHGVRASQVRSILGHDPWLGVTPPGIGFDLLLSPLLVRRTRGVSDRGTPALWEIGGRMGFAMEEAGWDTDLDAAARASPGAGPKWFADLLDPEALRLQDEESRALVAELARAAAADEEVIGAMRRAVRTDGPLIAAFSFPGFDRVAHVFLRYARPAEFGNVSGRDIDLYGPALERYYQKIDAIVGEILAPGRVDTLVLVTSTHGIEPMTAGARFLKEMTRGGPWSGVHGRCPAGFLLALGPGIRRGSLFGKGSLADVVPSALYALGLPVARDSDGTILTGLFSEAYTASHPVTVVGSYGSVR